MRAAVLLFRVTVVGPEERLTLLAKEAVESSATTTLVSSCDRGDLHCAAHQVPDDVLAVVTRLLGGDVESGTMEGDDGERWWLVRGDLECHVLLGSAYDVAVTNGLWKP